MPCCLTRSERHVPWPPGCGRATGSAGWSCRWAGRRGRRAACPAAASPGSPCCRRRTAAAKQTGVGVVDDQVGEVIGTSIGGWGKGGMGLRFSDFKSRTSNQIERVGLERPTYYGPAWRRSSSRHSPTLAGQAWSITVWPASSTAIIHGVGRAATAFMVCCQAGANFETSASLDRKR